MNSETGREDRSFKFASGPFKGRPLDAVGMPYRIIDRDGKAVAIFRNGSIATFYKDEPVLPKVEAPEPWPPPPGTPFVCENCRKEKTNWFAPCPHAPGGELPPDPLANCELWLKSPAPRYTVGALRRHDGSRPQHPDEPVYVVLELGRPLYNFDRATVGTGLREYLWLYNKLRALGRGRFKATREARQIYFL